MMSERSDAKARIEQEAQAAAREGLTLAEACPYPFDTEEGRHFTAVYLLQRPAASATRPSGVEP